MIERGGVVSPNLRPEDVQCWFIFRVPLPLHWKAHAPEKRKEGKWSQERGAAPTRGSALCLDASWRCETNPAGFARTQDSIKLELWLDEGFQESYSYKGLGS